ncbi:hypothetical protein HMPREF9989_03434, partial [Staphylococcus epidermidis NIHLM057]
SKENRTVGTPPKMPSTMVSVHIMRYFLVFEVVSPKLTHRSPKFFTFSDSLDQKEHTVKVLKKIVRSEHLQKGLVSTMVSVFISRYFPVFEVVPR